MIATFRTPETVYIVITDEAIQRMRDDKQICNIDLATVGLTGIKLGVYYGKDADEITEFIKECSGGIKVEVHNADDVINALKKGN